MDIKAFKMDGLGNDFVIIDNRLNKTQLNKEQIIKICDRDFLGCDQLILINNSELSDASIEFFNSDGGTSGACGNGTRCVADLIAKESNKKTIILTTESGNLKSEILGDKLVSTEIGIAKTKWNEIPLSENLDTKNLSMKIYDLDNKEYVGGTAVNVGNPHIIFFVKDNENFDIKKIGPEIEHHKFFPERCNVTLATIVNKELIKVRVWERGAGLTKACGTAACATAFAAKQNGLASNKVDIEFSTGKLSISINENNSIQMKGPVSDIKNIEIKI
jgi:diaminopimelate epimerase